jgi:hypothetical protein
MVSNYEKFEIFVKKTSDPDSARVTLQFATCPLQLLGFPSHITEAWITMQCKKQVGSSESSQLELIFVHHNEDIGLDSKLLPLGHSHVCPARLIYEQEHQRSFSFQGQDPMIP